MVLRGFTFCFQELNGARETGFLGSSSSSSRQNNKYSWAEWNTCRHNTFLKLTAVHYARQIFLAAIHLMFLETSPSDNLLPPGVHKSPQASFPVYISRFRPAKHRQRSTMVSNLFFLSASHCHIYGTSCDTHTQKKKWVKGGQFNLSGFSPTKCVEMDFLHRLNMGVPVKLRAILHQEMCP